MTKRNASRYPGIRSFERSEQHLFFGRARETQALFEAVKVKPLTVLFSQSGIGKTSLLNAGLAPLLEQNGYLPIVIRLQDTSLSPVETLQRVLSPYLDREKLEQFGQQPYSLWEYVRACSFGERPVADSDTPVPAVPVLLFDQFEELFTHAAQARDALTMALSDLLNERLPERVREQLRQHPRAQRSDELLDWYTPLKIKIVFAIRADPWGAGNRWPPVRRCQVAVCASGWPRRSCGTARCVPMLIPSNQTPSGRGERNVCRENGRAVSQSNSGYP